MDLEKLKMEIARNTENEFINHIYNLFIEGNEESSKQYIQSKIDIINNEEDLLMQFHTVKTF